MKSFMIDDVLMTSKTEKIRIPRQYKHTMGLISRDYPHIKRKVIKDPDTSKTTKTSRGYYQAAGKAHDSIFEVRVDMGYCGN